MGSCDSCESSKNKKKIENSEPETRRVNSLVAENVTSLQAQRTRRSFGLSFNSFTVY